MCGVEGEIFLSLKKKKKKKKKEKKKEGSKHQLHSSHYVE